MIDRPLVVLVPENPPLAERLAPLRVSPLEMLEHKSGDAVVFVDLLLPDGSGFELIRQLRASPATAQAWIVLVLDDDSPELRRRALRCGADDYVVGPLRAEHVAARVSSSPRPAAPDFLAHGTIRLDRAARLVRIAGKAITMGPNEFNVLGYLLENRDRVVTRNELIAAVKAGTDAIDSRTVDVWIGRLRRAVAAVGAPLPIRTVRQQGYVLDS